MTGPVESTHRVLLIRPWDMSEGVGAGCCGGGSTKGLCVNPEHHEAHRGFGERDDWDPLARIYLTLRDNLPAGVDLEIVDPRNHLYLAPAIAKDVRRQGLSWGEAVKAVLRGPAYAAIMVDGRTVSAGALPSPGEAVRLVREALGLHVI